MTKNNHVYLVTSEDYDSPGHPNEVHLATLDKARAESFYNEVKDMYYGFGYALYEIPLDTPSENHRIPLGKTTWLSDCQINYER